MRRYVVITIVIAFVFALGLVFWRSHQRSRYGFTLTRYSADMIRISWGTPSGVNISPEQTLRSFLGFQLEHESAEPYFPQLSTLENVWMYDIHPESLGGATPASYVNPLNDGSFDRMFEMIRLSEAGEANADSVTRIAAQNYAYLGWVLMNDDDVRSLKFALANRLEVDLNADIRTSNGVLYRLAPRVEKRLASNPNNQAELAAIRRAVPVMFEVLDPHAGHPCDAMHVLYLDGHVERIPVGERFPATRAFIESFPPPDLYPSKPSPQN